MAKKVLVAEDEKMMLKAISFKLQKEGYEVHAAEDGKQALELLRTGEFDLLVSDIMMPFASGLELVTEIKTNELKTKTLLLSALGQESTVLKAFSLGADDYMTKPFSPNELIVRIKKLIG
ncbi:MAG TPA: response regulator [Luteibaculaceae bacterium]|nr:response regulator [Luteibaculaceae bacterium]